MSGENAKWELNGLNCGNEAVDTEWAKEILRKCFNDKVNNLKKDHDANSASIII